MSKAKLKVAGLDDLLTSLTAQEKKYFQQRFEIMFEQADRDPVLEPTIRNIILNDLTISRLQRKIQDEFAQDNFQNVEKVQRAINAIQEKNLAALDSLNLTKAKKDALNKSPESTPSRLIAGFALAVSMMTQPEREKNKRDIEEAMDRLKKNWTNLLELIPSDLDDSQIDITD